MRIGSAHNRSARPFPGFGGGAPQAAPQPPSYGAPPSQQYESSPSQSYGGPPPQQYGGPPPQQYGGPPSQGSPPGYGNAQPNGTQQVLGHNPYNTPIHMYSGQNIADSYQAHADALAPELSRYLSLEKYLHLTTDSYHGFFGISGILLLCDYDLALV